MKTPVRRIRGVLPLAIVVLVAFHLGMYYYVCSNLEWSVVAVSAMLLVIAVKHLGMLGALVRPNRFLFWRSFRDAAGRGKDQTLRR